MEAIPKIETVAKLTEEEENQVREIIISRILDNLIFSGVLVNSDMGQYKRMVEVSSFNDLLKIMVISHELREIKRNGSD